MLEDCKQSQLAADHVPLDLLDLFIYIYREETKIWRRAYIKAHNENMFFTVEYQDPKKSIRKVDLEKVLFFIDQEYDLKSE